VATTTAPRANVSRAVREMHPRRAVEHTMRRNTIRVHLPLLGEVMLPPLEELVFVGGITVLTLLGLVDWPVALLVAVGHALSLSGRNRVLREFGAALEAA
jgi:hypothetical protein